MNLTLKRLFLHGIQLHDDKEWFLSHRDLYLEVFHENLKCIEQLINLIGKFDKTIAPLTTIDCSFAMLNDRKLKINNRQYKDYLCGSFTREGKYGGYASYYYQMSPVPSHSGGSFLAVGIYNPNMELMDYIRREFRTRGEHIVKLIHRSGFELFTKNKMTRIPSEFTDIQLPYRDYMRQRDFILIKHLDMSYFEQDNWTELAAQEFRRCKPFVEFINEIIDRYKAESKMPVGHGLRPIKRSIRESINGVKQRAKMKEQR